ncbi:hypothetical protein ACFZDJ_13280 [Streptomyces sp. NPDC007896]|uniref:hypothetical protein n=1 Tax=Streptomyces sp. NPDC007896 TaxID=3364784 RepID=UPI0036E211BA
MAADRRGLDFGLAAVLAGWTGSDAWPESGRNEAIAAEGLKPPHHTVLAAVSQY